VNRQIILATGGVSTLGGALYQTFAQRGHDIALAAGDDYEAARAVERDCAGHGVQTLLLSGDLCESGVAIRHVSDTISYFMKLDTVICVLERLDIDELTRTSALVAAASTAMSRYGCGRVLFIAPLGAGGQLSKIIQRFAQDFSPYGINVNGIITGATSGVPLLPREGTFQDIINAVEFLLSDKANYITGITLPVDGGLSAR